MASKESAGDRPKAQPPTPAERFACRFVPPPHPSVLDTSEISDQCEFRAQRRSGPGGQHRNKTSSGVFLEHRPTEIVAEATERRSQSQNRSVALTRLRMRLAVAVRTPPPSDAACPREEELRRRYRGTKLRLAETNPERPGVVALVLNDLVAAGGQPSLVSDAWATSTSALVTLLKSDREAWELVNAIRTHHGRPPLK